jgi:hypothetical protein
VGDSGGQWAPVAPGLALRLPPQAGLPLVVRRGQEGTGVDFEQATNRRPDRAGQTGLDVDSRSEPGARAPTDAGVARRQQPMRRPSASFGKGRAAPRCPS